MKATVDREGRIALGPELQADLGVQPGDDVLLIQRGGEWILRSAQAETGLSLEGNVLVHRGVSAAPDKALADARDGRFEALSEGLPR